MNRQEKQLYALFRKDWTLSAEAQRGLERSYEQIRQQCREQEEPMNRKRRKPITIIAIAAIVALFTISAAAVVLHSEFFTSAFGTGIKSDPVEVYTDPETGSEMTYPSNERVEVDVDAAEEVVGEKVATSDQSLEVCGYTITIDSYLVDSSGIGVLTYTVEHPDGISGLVGGDSRGGEANFNAWQSERDSDIFEPGISVDGEYIDYYTYVDRDSVTENQVTMVAYFCPFYLLDTPREIEFSVDYLTGIHSGDDPEFGESETLILPITDLGETQTYTDSETGISADVSPMGLKLNLAAWKQANGLDGTQESSVRKVEDENGELVPIDERIEISTHKVVLHYADGSEYTVKDDDIHNVTVEAGDNESTYFFYAFNRLVTNEIISVEFTGVYADWDGIAQEIHAELTP
ncbi:MAG: hypothetical protein IJ792_04700 [Oscillospiraceae bacterium]|nr:hypothetical protein [Oscillospiraceae bacterium]